MKGFIVKCDKSKIDANVNKLQSSNSNLKICLVSMQGQRTREGRNEGKCSLMCHTQIVQSDQITLFLYYVYCYIKNANYTHSAFLYVDKYVLQILVTSTN